MDESSGVPVVADASSLGPVPDVARDEQLVADQIRGIARLGVAYSGGVDSATLLAVALRALGRESVVALLARSASLASMELETARRVANELGAVLVEFETDETSQEAYRANGADRCYHCKNTMFTAIDDNLAADLGLTAIAYGENATDTLRRDRPGAMAAAQHRVLRPLSDAGLDKQRVRRLAHHLGVSVADKPAAPCLASRIPHGEPVTERKLAQIEMGEDCLRRLGFSDTRVRHHGSIARIEVPVGEINRFADDTTRKAVVDTLHAAGFAHVTVDLTGLQSGAFTLQVLGVREGVDR